MEAAYRKEADCMIVPMPREVDHHVAGNMICWRKAGMFTGLYLILRGLILWTVPESVY